MNSLLNKTIFILLFITLIFYIIFSFKKTNNNSNIFNYSNFNYDLEKVIYTNYLDKNLNLLRNYFYESFIESNKNNLKIIYCQVYNYSILIKLKKINKKNYSNEYIYISIFPVIRFKKTDNFLIKQEADKYSELSNTVLYLIDKELQKNLKLKDPIKIKIFDYNKLIIEK